MNESGTNDLGELYEGVRYEFSVFSGTSVRIRFAMETVKSYHIKNSHHFS
jgi:hypothetical protein